MTTQTTTQINDQMARDFAFVRAVQSNAARNEWTIDDTIANYIAMDEDITFAAAKARYLRAAEQIKDYDVRVVTVASHNALRTPDEVAACEYHTWWGDMSATNSPITVVGISRRRS